MSGCGCNKNKLNDYVCPITKIDALADSIFWLTVRCPELAESALPGNAVMVYPTSGLEPLLGRPFAVADADKERGEISVCFMLWGKGTKMLSGVHVGDTVRVRGVLGVPFDADGAKVHFAGGGAGVALFLYMCKLHPEHKAGLYLGVPGRGYERYVEKVLSVVPDAHIFADDGSFGDGSSMFDVIPKEPPEGEEIWTCGPPDFLAAMKLHCAARPDRLFFVLDRHMACGYGGCMGCTVKTVNGLKRLCTDQSKFRADEVIEDE